MVHVFLSLRKSSLFRLGIIFIIQVRIIKKYDVDVDSWWNVLIALVVFVLCISYYLVFIYIIFYRIFTPIWIPSKKNINMDGVHAVDRFSYEWPWLVGILALVLLVLLIVSCYFCWRSHECSGEMHYIDSTKPRSHSYYDCPIHGPVLIGGKTKLGDKDIITCLVL